MGDPKEEALIAIAEHFAREEERWLRENPGQVRFYLLKAPDEPPTYTEEGQVDLRKFVSDLRDNHIDASTPFMTMDSVGAIGGYTGEIAVLIHAVTPALTGLLGAWIQYKIGRKVRLRVGDVEVEAKTLHEVEQLLQHVQSLRESQERPKD